MLKKTPITKQTDNTTSVIDNKEKVDSNGIPQLDSADMSNEVKIRITNKV